MRASKRCSLQRMISQILIGHGITKDYRRSQCTKRMLEVRKAMGPDGVSGWKLTEYKEQLLDLIWEIITSSIIEGKVPLEWKRANVIPIFKGGKATEPLNYKPVTSVVGKLCEIIIKENVLIF
ncbi:hypothetical protein E2C01_042434 [Portunus trituberculatus]|uniref:Uncharacterized protein n=1 Tax=Portunus trituberculatus TaxID=210409 RepID=A0A5B7FUN1_PORTR|nr:hypothetical protein [Portunus trituberculatus]